MYAIDPYFSPDGRSIAYSRTVAPPNVQDPPEWKLYSAIFIVGLEGKNSHQVTSTPKRRKGQLATETGEPAFSPNGKMLTFVRTRYEPEEHTAIFVQPIGSPEDAHRITPWKMNCQDHPEFSPTASWCSSVACLKARRAPPTSTGSTPTARACTSSPTHPPISSTWALASLRASPKRRAG